MSGLLPTGGRYEQRRLISKGVSALVLEAWDKELLRSVVLKLEPGSRSGTIEHEAGILGRLDHPAIVRLHETSSLEDGRRYSTMPLVVGRGLEAILADPESAPEERGLARIVSVVASVGDALAHAHSHSVVHGDIDPCDVMVGPFGEVVVLGWSRAKIASPTSAAYRDDIKAVGLLLDRVMARIPGAPSELAAVRDKAIDSPPTTYEDVAELTDDLRAWLEGRVVQAYATGAWPELRKWVGRNRPLAAGTLGVLSILVAGVVANLMAQASSNRALQGSIFELDAAITDMNAEAERAGRKADEVRRLGAAVRLQGLVQRSRDLWPAFPDRVSAYEDWLREADDLLAELDDHRNALRSLKATATPPDEIVLSKADSLARRRERLEARWRAKARDIERARREEGRTAELTTLVAEGGELLARIEELDAVPIANAEWHFERTEDAWLHERLVELIIGLEELREVHAPDVRRRRGAALTVAERSVASERQAALWREAIASIGNPAECPTYGGLELTPELGLVPVGRDPHSGLWEFVDVQTGTPPARDPDSGELVVTESTGVVLVLLPGGVFRMGAQRAEPDGENHDPQAKPDEGPVHDVELRPFLCSKYEMTRGQWRRVADMEPYAFAGLSHTHPAENVSWEECQQVLERVGMDLPTEAQWEYAARGGTTTPWPSGDTPSSLEGFGNVSDASHRRTGVLGPELIEWDDGFELLAPVGSFRPNRFGLHDFVGNVSEWCRDSYASYQVRTVPGDGLRIDAGSPRRIIRGSTYFNVSYWIRSAWRHARPTNYRYRSVGVRPVRRLR